MKVRVELRGRESQCPVCDRIFTSDVICEKHKSYSGNRTVCADPVSLGMVEKEASSDRGFKLWTLPIPEELQWWNKAPGEAPAPAGPQVLTCARCGVVWERPAQRGRKPHNCASCAAIIAAEKEKA